jgi:hypothetical protein
MYSFAPLAAVPVDHVGFIISVFMIVLILIVTVFTEPEEFFIRFFFGAVVVVSAYGISYHVCDQRTQTFVNTPVTAVFSAYAPEGYREKSGKSYVDRHYVYVVYTVNGNPVLLQAQEGAEYPKTVTLYKN